MEPDSPQQISNLPELEVLKGRLVQQEAAKLKAEQIVSTLSRIKAREKASRRRISTRDESSVVSSGDRKSSSVPNSAVKEKSNLLRRKLEEDRAKVESQRGSENLDKVNEVVETIKAQLEDRGKLMQQLLLNAQQQQLQHNLLKASIDDDKSENEPPSEPVLPDEIKQKIADLEAKIIDLQENLKEKDEVISARTQAITLLSEDMSRKSKTTLDTLEETQEQMRQMQNNFILIEDKMKQEHHRLKEEAEDRKNRCLQAEKNLRLVEAARFDLSTRVAELQEKVVVLQTKNIELEKSISEAETKQTELQSALDAAKNTSVKMKAQYKIKIKTLEEERDQYKKMVDDGNVLTSLQERIAELEEEKGNLQLSLVDFDEQQEQCHLLKERVTELEQKLLQQGDDLDSHVKAMSKLELEKLDLIQVVQERNSLLSDKDLLIDKLQQQLIEIEQLKVSAEIRSIELEEKLDGFMRDKRAVDSENETDLGNLKEQLNLQEETINELKIKLLSRQTDLVHGGGDGSDLSDVSSELEEWKEKYFRLETRYNEVNDMYKSVEKRVEEAEKQNECIVTECNGLKATIIHLQSVVNEKSSDKVDRGITCVELTAEPLQRSLDSDHEKDCEINRLREELGTATVELHRLSTAFDNLNITSQQIDELNKQIVEKDKELINVNNELEKRSRKLSDYKKFHKLKSEDVLRVSHELEAVTASYQEKIVELEGEIARAREKEAQLQKEIKELKENVQNNQVAPSDQTQKIKKLVANLKLKAKVCKDLEAKLEENKTFLKEKDIFIQELITKENNYLTEISELKSKSSELLSVSDDKPSEHEQISEMSSKLETLSIERDNQNSKILDQQQLICQLEDEIKIIKEERELAFSEIEKIQENEFSKNDEMFRNFENQVSESRTEMESLQGQLKDAVTQFQQAWAKLQEKEAYIESLETELIKSQEKLQSIGSSTDERTRSLREKTEVLGDRLNKVEKINAELQKYKNEVEQRFIVSDESEMLLKKSLADTTNENEELRQSINEMNNRVEWFEGENNNLKNYITNLQNEMSNLNYVRDSYNQSLQEIERLNNDLKLMKQSNERTITELNEREKISVESLENELKSLADKCNMIENERNHLSKEYENVHSENQLLKEEMDKFKTDFESKYSFVESERIHFELLYSNLKAEINLNEEKLGTISENKNKEIEDIMNQQRLLVERLHSEFKQKEDSYFDKIQEQEEYNLKLQQSLQTIETNAELLRCKLIEVGSELASSKEELIALKNDQERTLHLKNELEKIKEDYYIQLEGERNRVKALEVELLREKARKEIDIVVKEAEIKVDSMSQAEATESNPPLFKFSESDQDDFSKSFGIVPEFSINQEEKPPVVKQSEVKDVDELTRQLNFVLEENERLSAIVSSYDTNRQSVEAEIVPSVEPYSFSLPSRIENKDEEDGWGWGGEEGAIMEQEISMFTGAASDQPQKSPQHLDDRISLLEQKLQETEAEKAKLSEELKASQIRCTKLVKKAKEFKAKSDDLERGTREKSIGFEDLDFAMQEELREQIVKLEKSLQEAVNENKNWKTEKENYLRKIDTLISGNERLIEMKERQDIELSIFEKQNSDFKQQILAFEWKVEELIEDNDRLTKNITEMEEKINNLASENEHLIKIVGDMKDQQKGTVVPAQQEVNIQESNQNPMFTMFHDVSSTKQQRTEDIYDSLTLKNHEQLSHEKNEIMTINNELKLQADVLNTRINDLEIENLDLRNRIENYQESADIEKKLVNDFEKLQQNCKTDKERLHLYETKLEELENEKRSLEDSFTMLQTTVTSLKDKNHLIKDELENKYEKLLKDFNFIKDELQEVKKERDNLIVKLTDISEENNVKTVSTEPSGTAMMFRGFADDSSDNDPFNIAKDLKKQEYDLPKYRSWDNIEQTKNVTTNNVYELKEQVQSLTALLQEKEMELEISKQSLDNLKLESENLQDVWSKKYEDLKMVLNEKYEDLENEQTKKNKNYEDIQLEQSNACTDNLGVYEDVLNAAEQKFNYSILLKDEEIAHLTNKLSAKEQVQSLTSLLQDKEMELEILKQSLDNIKLENENLQDDWSKKYEDLKMALNEKYEDLENEQTKKNKNYEDIQLEQSNVCTDNLGVYEDVLNAAEQKFKYSILLKDEEIAHLTCELSSKEQQLINLKKEISTLTSNGEELVKIIDTYKSQNELQWKTVNELREECVKLQEQLKEKETQNVPVTYIEDKEVMEQQLETAKSHPPAAVPSNLLQNDPHQINVDEHTLKFKEMIKQRDIEIERLLEALGEAEERLIKIEEMRLSGDEVNGLKLKLDEALYTLHLRDVRCEELTLELMQLLEERDTLQLRLSTAIRMNEEMRRKGTSSIGTSIPIEPISTTNNSSSCTTRTSSIEHNPSSSDQETTQSDSESGRLDRLNEKLGELHTTGYQRDLSLHQDRIKRHNEQMHLYSPASSPQQHQLPNVPDAHISISNEDSNTSGGFFSWIFGGNG